MGINWLSATVDLASSSCGLQYDDSQSFRTFMLEKIKSESQPVIGGGMVSEIKRRPSALGKLFTGKDNHSADWTDLKRAEKLVSHYVCDFWKNSKYKANVFMNCCQSYSDEACYVSQLRSEFLVTVARTHCGLSKADEKEFLGLVNSNTEAVKAVSEFATLSSEEQQEAIGGLVHQYWSTVKYKNTTLEK